ncbi:MAG: nuclear transport factor 2 family protein [Gemmatimonadales bacterium]|jgi:ketosteroid isomerase-like protein
MSGAGMAGLEPPIEAMLDATNRGDRDALLAAFEPDAVLVDWGRTFTGKKAIARWNDDENMGTQNRIEVTGVERSAAGVAVKVAVSGTGYNGEGTLTFQLGARGISRLVIT